MVVAQIAHWKRAVRSIAAVAVLAAVVSCSSGQDSAVQLPADVTRSEMASPTDPNLTAPPTSIVDTDVPEMGLPQIEIANIVIDADQGEVQEAIVPLGSPVNIRVISSQSDEFHLHGYDLELTGTDVTFSFTADRVGDFILEGHASGQQLLVLTVFQD